MVLNFALDSFSPVISYSPASDWNFATTAGLSFPNVSHASTDVNGSSFSFSLLGSNIRIYGTQGNPQSSYAVSLDGSNDMSISRSILFDQDILDANYTHDFALTNNNSSHLVFDYAVWQLPVQYDSSDVYSTSNSVFTYSSGWNTVSDNNTGFNGYTTSLQSASVNFTFKGNMHNCANEPMSIDAFCIGNMAVIYGLVCPECGQYSITTDGQSNSTRTFNASKPVSLSDVVLYYGFFDYKPHSLLISNLGGGSLNIGRAQVIQDSKTAILSADSKPADDSNLTIADIVAIAVCSALFGLVLIGLYANRWYRRRHQNNRTSWSDNPPAPVTYPDQEQTDSSTTISSTSKTHAHLVPNSAGLKGFTALD